VTGILILLTVIVVLIGVGFVESHIHRRNVALIPIRIHVNGTRGKSSVTRLIAGGLREGEIATCAKTTGTLARMILPDGTEYPVFRPSGPNVIEQIRIVSVAAHYRAKAIVVECMAVQPQLQWFSESTLVKSTHGVITNAREDHLDVMGPGESDVALALAGSTPIKGKLFTAEEKYLPVFRNAGVDRETDVIGVTRAEIEDVTDEEMATFPYVEHKENVALALRVCRELGVERAVALRGMWQAPPDPGAMTISHVRFFGRDLHFVNAFAANDPQSTEFLWNMVIEKFPDLDRRIAIFNCRTDRAKRSQQLGKACAAWQGADCYLLMGTGTYFFSKAAIAEGIPERKLIFAERAANAEIFEMIIDKAGKSALVVGMGNTKGQGLSLARYFRNRAIMTETRTKEAG
jgi:gamma-polyglutamate synthase